VSSCKKEGVQEDYSIESGVKTPFWDFFNSNTKKAVKYASTALFMSPKKSGAVSVQLKLNFKPSSVLYCDPLSGMKDPHFILKYFTFQCDLC
jgi:hypothetical protein